MFRADDVIGEYRLLSLLGEGALGVVWHAQRIDRPQTVALKLIQPSRVPEPARAQAYDGLTRALTRTGRLEHDNLQSLLGTSLRAEDGVFGLAARHYDGGPFENIGNVGRTATLLKALGLLRQLAGCLAWLHDLGLVHGNIKPSNALITPTASGPRLVLMDLCWSTAHLGRRTEKTRIFVSPEQLAKQSATAASDQWSTARMLHQLAVRGSPGISQTEALTSLPLPVLKVMKRALEHDPKARFASMQSFLQALENAEEELGSAGSSAPSALPTPTLEVSVSDAIAMRTDERKTERPQLEIVELPDPAEDPTPAGATPAVPEAATEPGTLKRIPPKPQPPAPQAVEPGQADPSQDTADPTTPMSLQSINPSGDRGDPRPPRTGPIQPSDPTDILPVVQPTKKSGPGFILGLVLSVAAIVIIASALVLWKKQADEGAPTEIATRIAEPKRTPPAPTAPAAPATSGAKAKPAPPAAPPAPTKAPAPAPKTAAAPEPPPAAAPPPSAIDTLTAGCEASRRSDCRKLAEAYLKGDGVTQNRAQGRRYYGRACDLRLISACETAGRLHASTGRSSDAKRARRYFERACDTGKASACGALADLWLSGRGGASNPRTAEALAKRACQMGHKPSCR